VRIKPFQAIYPNLDIIASVDSFFKSVKYDFRQYDESGFFERTDSEGFYIYEILTPNNRHRGILATVDIQDYIEGNILKHEETLSTKEQSMMNLLLERRAMIKPVLLTYPKKKKVRNVIDKSIDNKPIFEIYFEESKEQHRVWKISDKKKMEGLKKLFKKIPKCYIADGHHRCSTSSRLHLHPPKSHPKLDFSKLLCLFFSFEELVIHDYNRVIDILGDVKSTVLMAELSKYCKIKRVKEGYRPQKKHEMSFYIHDEWYRLQWRKKVMKKYKNSSVILDSSLVNDIIMGEIMGIKDVSGDSRITYIEGTKKSSGISNACKKNANRVGIGLYPVYPEEFKTLSDQGITLPPKSTWFEPRVKNGLISQDF